MIKMLGTSHILVSAREQSTILYVSFVFFLYIPAVKQQSRLMSFTCLLPFSNKHLTAQ